MEKDKYYESIKGEILNNEITKRVKDYSKNRSDLRTYASIGKTLEEAGKHYGEGIIKKYAEKLTRELGKNYSATSLKYMRQFYRFSKSHSVSDQLTLTHYRCLMTFKSNEEINYYIKLTEIQNLSVRELCNRIKNKEYERLDEEAKEKIKKDDKQEITDYIKNPIMIQNKNRYEEISEKLLQRIILEDIPSFLKELGTGFTFIENEYKIKLGNRYNYIDLLLFNIEYNCYVVVELKLGELKKEHIGQIEVYMNYIDKNIKKGIHDKTIGIILVRKNNKYVMEYCSDERIKTREYVLI